MNKRTFGIGIIGFGGFGQFLFDSWSTMDGIVVRAVADAHQDAEEALRRRVREAGTGPNTAFYGDWRTILDNEEVDIVSIVTPPGSHAEMADAALRAGKHVLIEKPLATSLEEARHIRAAAVETGRVVAIDYMLRFNPIVETLQRWARDGAFGSLRRVVVENYAQDESLPPAHWFWDRMQSGGILVEHAVHFIDVVNGCTRADPLQVDGLLVRRDDGRADRMGLTTVYADGLVNQQYHAFSRPNFFEQTGMRFVFDLAQIDVDGWIPLSGTIDALVNPATAAALEDLPQLDISERSPVGGAGRSTGAGAPPNDADGALRSGGIAYRVDERVRARFALPGRKTDAYAAALRALMADVVASIRNSDHRLRAGLPEAVRSLEIALAATDQAFAHASPSSR